MTKTQQSPAVKKLAQIAKKVKSETPCDLAKTCTNPVPGEGSANAKIVFVGEAPGKNEDLQGRPFVGAAGKLLDELLACINLERKDVYITNVVKYRPPNNRDPRPEEIEACRPYLRAEMEAIQPKLIVPLGRHALNRFIPDLSISKEHGQPKRYRGIFSEKQVYFPMYHPAAALYNPHLKETLREDMKKIPQLLEIIDPNE